MYASDDDWHEFLVMLEVHEEKKMHQLWELKSDGIYFKLCKISREFPDKFREY
jgi:hypothetical protein